MKEVRPLIVSLDAQLEVEILGQFGVATLIYDLPHALTGKGNIEMSFNNEEDGKLSEEPVQM